jgi:hypothetical protein
MKEEIKIQERTGSKGYMKFFLPLPFLELFIIFLQRTLVSLPIAALIAHMLF